MKRISHNPSRVALLVSIIVAAAGSGAALAVAAQGSHPTTQPAHAATSSSNVGTMSSYPEQTAAFAAFRRSATAADEALASNSSVQSFFASHPTAGAQLELSRAVYQDANVTLGIFPTARNSSTTESGVCLIVATAEGAIVAAPAPISEAKIQPLVIRYKNSAEEHLYGVVPDGVHSVSVTVANGEAAKVLVNSDGGFAFTSETPITGWSYLDANGVTHNHAIESPASWTAMGNS